MEKNTEISIVVPTYNEQDAIIALTERINAVLQAQHITYEIIFMDDRSTDKTQEFIRSLHPTYPVSLYVKTGSRGKATSLVGGFSYAKYPLICMIDADLQYPPEAIPNMIAKIHAGADIIVAERKKAQGNALGKLLHTFDVDVQSGLKVFKKEIIERISVNATKWAFDLEFLVKARSAGYTIATENVVYAPRSTGKNKTNAFFDAFHINWEAIKLRIAGPEIIPFSPEMMKEQGIGFHYNGAKFIHHTSLHHTDTAFFRLITPQRATILVILLILLVGFIINWHVMAVISITILTTLYFIDLLFNFFLIYRSFYRPPEIVITKAMMDAVSDTEWPVYTIFCPLYKEWQVIPQFVSSIESLDYPKDKLDVMLLLEEDDKETIKKVEEYNLPSYIQAVVVPHSMPKTKPKAMNYGLLRAKGEYLTIYDAEDVPEIDQLKKAVLGFKQSDNKVVCIQAKLNFYNPHQNIITKIFTAEYSLWFDLVLTGLQSIKAPIPLGGTSNHFRTKDLVHLKGWDSFNVTEDCDLGMRLVKQGFRTAIIDSTTHEEANSGFFNWFTQRSRWIKGYMQTYFVHMRKPGEFRNDWRNPHLITFQLVVGGKIVSMFINPFMWVITIVYFVYRARFGAFIESFYLTPVFYMGIFSITVGNFLYLYYYAIGCAKRGYDSLIKYMFLVPFYWLAMSIAAWMAVYELIIKPHYWAKTKHGLHLDNKNAVKHASGVIGRDLVDKGIKANPFAHVAVKA